MKHPILFFLSLLLFAFSSCQDPCKKITCANGGFCFHGECQCQIGYEGANCTTEARTKFFGTYNATDTCTSTGIHLYTANISGKTIDPFQITIANFYGGFTNYIIGSVSGTSISIPSQFPDNNNIMVFGNGTLYKDTIAFNYHVIDYNIGLEDSCANSKWVR